MATLDAVTLLIQKAVATETAALKEAHRKELKKERAKVTRVQAQRDEHRARAKEVQANMYRYQKEIAELRTALRKSV